MRLLFLATDVNSLVANRLPVMLGAMNIGHEVEVACVDGGASEVLRAHNIPFHALPVNRKGTNPFSELVSLFRIALLVRKRKPDIVHAVAIKAMLYGGIVSRMTGVPAFVGAVAGMGSIFIGSRRRTRWLRVVVERLLRIALSHPNKTVIVQNPDDERAVRDLFGLEAADVRIIRGSGMDVAGCVVRPEREGGPVVVMVSRLLYDKGVAEFVHAARRVRNEIPSARFLLAGLPDEGNPTSIEAEVIASWRAENVVEFLGYRADVRALYEAANLAVLPSYREGLPKALIEAAACGRAVVASNAPGCNFAVEPGVTGLLVPVRDGDALGDAILELLRDHRRRAEMGRAGRRLAEREFAIEKIVAAHLNVYERLQASTGRVCAGWRPG